MAGLLSGGFGLCRNNRITDKPDSDDLDKQQATLFSRFSQPAKDLGHVLLAPVGAALVH
jgi:hypothetical protein